MTKTSAARVDSSHATDNGCASANSRPANFEQHPSTAVRDRRLRLAKMASLVALATLMFAYTLYVARAIFVPVTVAVIFNFVLSPIVRRLGRMGVPNMAGVRIVLVGLIAMIAVGIMQLQARAIKWLEDAPTTIPRIQAKLSAVKQPVKEIAEASVRVETIAEGVPKKDVVKVDVQRPSLASVVLSRTTTFLASSFLSMTLL